MCNNVKCGGFDVQIGDYFEVGVAVLQPDVFHIIWTLKSVCNNVKRMCHTRVL